ncbi:efflux RND transporter periplasmic adaptor subunit [Sinomicrobium weinanense]|uniref:Efflux RND transporter periplasmic adaptor subunit n=1 Tax=Sinomicrobium weinanense TaxID=2842200 RepID=A0A926JU77_9FLAO|nr:efflux RND transporter periplasmic adaptor subunit [Sinomicrobium weinanense]MBC9797612.1 efflux RND transporter periplasmic adaptor subunit [Sinomicrobium weinanense]MBU3123434.1 efflux RND transporter periplasmic adaptor subunit [Sinomicrobium weinanense]
MKRIYRNNTPADGKRNFLAFFSTVAMSSMLLVFSACHESRETTGTGNSSGYCLDTAFREKIQLETARIRPVEEGITLTGIVESNPDKVVPFSSLVDGVISGTHFSLGDEVNRGQVLAEVQSSELNNLKSERKSLESGIAVAERELRSVRSMYEDGIASQKDLLVAESELKTKQAALENVMATLGLYGSSSENGSFLVKSPVSGVITEKNVATGMRISADGGPLFTVADLSEVWVLLNIYAGNVTKLHTGQEVDIKTLSYPDEVFSGTITYISQVFDSEERVLKARVVIPNKDHKLKPGMSADIKAKKDRGTQAVTISTRALIFDDNRYFAVVYRGDCDLEVREIEVLGKHNHNAYTSGGLEENEQVVVKNLLLIYEQLKGSGS